MLFTDAAITYQFVHGKRPGQQTLKHFIAEGGMRPVPGFFARTILRAYKSPLIKE